MYPYPRQLLPALLSVAVPDATLTPPSLESYLLHLTSMDGGNAKGLYGTILAMQSYLPPFNGKGFRIITNVISGMTDEYIIYRDSSAWNSKMCLQSQFQ